MTRGPTRLAKRLALLSSLGAGLLAGSSAIAQNACQPKPFAAWLDGVKAEATAQGVSPTAADSLDGITFAPEIVARDHAQGVFNQSFLQFAGRMVAGYRLTKGAQLIKKNADTFADIEQKYGVPAPVLVAFWGLETDFGAVQGKLPTLRSLATLAYDCRRPDLFHTQLIDALKVIDRGDLTADEMIGPFAGELGQFQFLASLYLQYAVDEDGDGRRDLLHSAPDALASAANYLKAEGWQAGQPWLQEVTVPETMPWDQADPSIQHPVSQWQQWGVEPAHGALAAPSMQASLLLPMGRLGPAFLAYPNFGVYLKWNQSGVYSTTAAYFATRLAGAPAVGRGRGEVAVLSSDQIRQLQQGLAKAGFDVGTIDGKLGSSTRQGVRAMQVKFGLPADGYPTPELLQRLQAAG